MKATTDEQLAVSLIACTEDLQSPGSYRKSHVRYQGRIIHLRYLFHLMTGPYRGKTVTVILPVCHKLLTSTWWRDLSSSQVHAQFWLYLVERFEREGLPSDETVLPRVDLLTDDGIHSQPHYLPELEHLAERIPIRRRA